MCLRLFLKTASFVIVASSFSACGESTSSQKRSSTETKEADKEENTATTKVSADSAEGIDFQGLDYFPHILNPLPANSAMVVVEAGYLDVRQNKVNSAGGSKDYRASTIGLYGGPKLEALTSGYGCFDMKAFTGKNTLTDVESTGFYKGSPKNTNDKIRAYYEEDSSTVFDPAAPLSFTAKLNGKSIKVENKDLPPRGSISFSKAVYTFFGTHSLIEDINTSLTNSKQNLVMTEETGNASIDAVSVNFYGSGSKVVRCVLKPGDSATLTKEKYSTIIPLRAITVTYMSIEITEQEGTTVLRTTYGGIGLEDMGVPK
jgi:hypothetical protein